MNHPGNNHHPTLSKVSIRSAQAQLAPVTAALVETQRFLAAEGLAAQRAPAELKQEMMSNSTKTPPLELSYPGAVWEFQRNTTKTAPRGVYWC